MIVLQVRSIEANRSLAPIMGGLVKIKDSGETVDIGGRQSVMVSLFPDPDCERIVLFCPDCVFLFRLQWAQFRLKYCFLPLLLLLLLLLFLSTLNKKGNLLAAPLSQTPPQTCNSWPFEEETSWHWHQNDIWKVGWRGWSLKLRLIWKMIQHSV